MLMYQDFSLLENSKMKQMIEVRTIALKMDKKMKATQLRDLNCMKFLYFIQGEQPDFTKIEYTVPEYLVSTIREKWLLDISIENEVIRVKSIAQTDNWIKEMVEQEICRYWDAFGYGNFEIACKNLGLEAKAKEIGKAFNWKAAARRVRELRKMRAETCAALYEEIRRTDEIFTARLEAIVNEGK